MSAVLLAWATEIGLITWRDIRGQEKNHSIAGLPLPADYLATFIIFGGLAMVPKGGGAGRAAALGAWAYVVATYLNAVPAILNPSGAQTTSGTKSGTSTTTSPPPSATVG